jgi:threonine synthase
MNVVLPVSNAGTRLAMITGRKRGYGKGYRQAAGKKNAGA